MERVMCNAHRMMHGLPNHGSVTAGSSSAVNSSSKDLKGNVLPCFGPATTVPPGQNKQFFQ
jgi:hypothetical protein